MLPAGYLLHAVDADKVQQLARDVQSLQTICSQQENQLQMYTSAGVSEYIHMTQHTVHTGSYCKSEVSGGPQTLCY